MSERLPSVSPIQEEDVGEEQIVTDKNGEDNSSIKNTPVFKLGDLMNAVRFGTKTHIDFILEENKHLIEEYGSCIRYFFC